VQQGHREDHCLKCRCSKGTGRTIAFAADAGWGGGGVWLGLGGLDTQLVVRVVGVVCGGGVGVKVADWLQA
jgi:hypothetical protein